MSTSSLLHAGLETTSPQLLVFSFWLKHLPHVRCCSKCWEYDSEENRRRPQPQRPCNTNLCQGASGGSSVRPGKRADQRSTKKKPVHLLSASLVRDKSGRRCQDPSCVCWPLTWLHPSAGETEVLKPPLPRQMPSFASALPTASCLCGIHRSTSVPSKNLSYKIYLVTVIEAWANYKILLCFH